VKKDPAMLHELVKEINRLLDERPALRMAHLRLSDGMLLLRSLPRSNKTESLDELRNRFRPLAPFGPARASS
jgi:hypothetical protein